MEDDDKIRLCEAVKDVEVKMLNEGRPASI
jgi:hypothetical protein